jgi:RNA polymerase sigma-70 factor (ECF subfamily)
VKPRTDAELVEATRETGDTAAYGELVTRYQGHAYGLAYSLLGDWAQAEDMAQEAFVRAYVNLNSLQDASRFPAWLRRIVFGTCIDWLRAYRPELYRSMGEPEDVAQVEAIADPQGATPLDKAVSQELSDVVLAAIDELPPRYRIPLTMFHLDGLSYQKVAEFLEVPLGTVKSLISRARKKLRPALEAYAVEALPMVSEVFTQHKLGDEFARGVLERAADQFDELIGRLGQHGVVAGEEVYIQPCVYLSLHLVQMRAAGWTEVDFDHLAAVSSASSLFAYEPGRVIPKYANLHIGMDQRITDATGFGYEWVDFKGLDGAWHLLKESVDAGRPVKGWHWENVVFVGYEDAERVEGRRVYAMCDGPETFSGWWVWRQFEEWFGLVDGWGYTAFGRHTQRHAAKPPKEVARGVMHDLVAWSTDPPSAVRHQLPDARLGLAGIAAYAADVADAEHKPSEYFKETAWLGCHAINPQWAIRNSTAVYLDRLARSTVFPPATNRHLLAAASDYRCAYLAWQDFYRELGHGAPDGAWDTARNRLAGAAAAQSWLEHETAALAEVEQALALL